MSEIADRLADIEEIENLQTMFFEGTGSRNRRLSIHGYDLDDSDGSIALAVYQFFDTPDISVMTMTDAERLLRGLETFVEEALINGPNLGWEESSQAFQLALDLRQRSTSTTRYRLYLFTDGRFSDRIKIRQSSTIGNTPVDYHFWDMQRLFQVYESQHGREELEIDLTEWLPSGLKVLAVGDIQGEFRTYLATVPGSLIADLYGRFGSRLLESNVRSYLSARGKINRGIRTTVLAAPEMFLAFNNGITATATDVKIEETCLAITHIRDLQIVNGGQTTASLFFLRKDEGQKLNLDDVYVQMKLVVVEPRIAAQMVPNIARFANSQNRISEADFFSNSPFHVRLEELSRRVLAPAQAGIHYQTKWFYERTRGQYLNERNKLGSVAEKQFTATNPKSQVITKSDAAKYEVAWGMKPHKVSSGAQKNFVEYANQVDSEWDSHPERFNEEYYRNLVAKSILFNQVRQTIASAPWYERGYLANIVAYTVSKIAHEIKRQGGGRDLDFAEIWNQQRVPPEVLEEARDVALIANNVLNDPQRRIRNVTEWAKSEDCWKSLQAKQVSIPQIVSSHLAKQEAVSERKREAVQLQKLDDGIDAQRRALEINRATWLSLESFATERGIGSPTDLDILKIASGQRRGFLSDKQSQKVLAFLERARKEGFSDL